MKKQRSFRGQRIGEEIMRIVSDLLARELKDPVFGDMISITYVKSTDDGSFATVYFTCLESNDAEVEAGFEKAKGFIRNEIVRRLGIRRAPELRFKVDDTARYGQRIDSLLEGLDLPVDTEMTGRAIVFSELPEIIDAYERYLIFTHVHMDGDTLGAAVAFADAMREIGREAWVVVCEDVPQTLELINAHFVIGNTKAADIVSQGAADENERPPYLAVLMDFAEEGRLEGEGIEALFETAGASVCIDHHVTSKPTCVYNYIDAKAAATSELVYRLLRAMGLPITERAATALYVGLVTDTGRFQYTNTTPDTHRIAAELLEAGANFGAAYTDIYQSVKAKKLFVQSTVLTTLDIFADDRAAIAFASADTLARLGAGEDETDGMSELLRGIEGIEVAAFLKELPNSRVKVSMRSKDWFDVAAFCAGFGGGGHVRAAGFTLELPMQELLTLMKEKLTSVLR